MFLKPKTTDVRSREKIQGPVVKTGIKVNLGLNTTKPSLNFVGLKKPQPCNLNLTENRNKRPNLQKGLGRSSRYSQTFTYFYKTGCVRRYAYGWSRWKSRRDATRVSTSHGQVWPNSRLHSSIHGSFCSDTKCTADFRCSAAAATTAAVAAATAGLGSDCDTTVHWLAAARVRNALL